MGYAYRLLLLRLTAKYVLILKFCESYYTEKLYTLLQDVLSNADERCVLLEEFSRDVFIGTDEFITDEEQLYAPVDRSKKIHHSGIIVKDYLEREQTVFRSLIILDEE